MIKTVPECPREETLAPTASAHASSVQPAATSGEDPSPRPRWTLRILTGLVVLALAFATFGVVTPPSANAATVRAGAGTFQVDVLLDGVETQRAASSWWGSTQVCTAVASAGASGASLAGKLLVGRWLVSGVVGGVAGGLACTAIISTCAAQAYHAGRWAGITVTPTGFWCWKY